MGKRADFVDVIRTIADAGFRDRIQEMKSGWVKVNGTQGRRLYVRKGTTVDRIDVAGWEHPGALEHPNGSPSGSVTGWISLERDGLPELVKALKELDGDLETESRRGPTRRTVPSVAEILDEMDAEGQHPADEEEVPQPPVRTRKLTPPPVRGNHNR